MAKRFAHTALRLLVIVMLDHTIGGASANTRDSGVPPPADEDQACTLVKGAVRIVTSIIDSETVRLDDRSIVRLVGALAPRASDSGNPSTVWPIELEATAFLKTLLVGKTVRLAYANTQTASESSKKTKPATDRHGRHLAHLFLGHDDQSSVWVQGALLRAGLARAYILPGHERCLNEMKQHEAIARRARLGLWGNRLYRIKRAIPGPGLMRFRNRFELIEGVVSNVAVTRNATYINFGSNWRTDFTIRIDRKLRKAHAAWSRVLPALKGKRVTVRGWIERRNGPEIHLWHPDQIDVEADSGQPISASDRSTSSDMSPSERRTQAPSTRPHIERTPDHADAPKEKPARSDGSSTPADFDL